MTILNGDSFFLLLFRPFAHNRSIHRCALSVSPSFGKINDLFVYFTFTSLFLKTNRRVVSEFGLKNTSLCVV